MASRHEIGSWASDSELLRHVGHIRPIRYENGTMTTELDTSTISLPNINYSTGPNGPKTWKSADYKSPGWGIKK